MYLNKTIANLIATLVSGLISFGYETLEVLFRNLKNIKTLERLYEFIFLTGIIGVLVFGRLTLNTLRLYIKYRDISKDIQQIGKALLNGLIKARLINASSDLKVISTRNKSGSVFCHLEGASTFEKSTFINALIEVISPINNPRYVIIRKSKFMLFVKQRDYHSVPEFLGKNKKLAIYFKNQWEILVGGCDLIFTRTIEGRKIILQSRVKSLASQFEEKIEHVNKWR